MVRDGFVLFCERACDTLCTVCSCEIQCGLNAGLFLQVRLDLITYKNIRTNCYKLLSQLYEMLKIVKLIARSSNNVSWNFTVSTTNGIKVLGACILKTSFSTKNETGQEGKPEIKKTSKAMLAYLERAKKYEEFMKKEKLEYQIGKRHLANMMGEDPELFTQDDVDKAIEYLFPSGLFEPKARPFMKPPEVVYPPHKAAEFDETGRPYHFLFYTGKCNFYQLLYDVVEHLNELNNYEDKMIRKQLTPDPTQTLNLSGSEWLSQDVLEHQMVEKLHEADYTAFKAAFERLASHPYSYRCRDFILAYRKQLLSQSSTKNVPELLYDENGRSYITTTNCLRKRAWAEVTVRGTGSGKITINGKGLNYFSSIQCREQVIFPLIFTSMLKAVDVEAHVEGGGPSGQAGAVRWGISTCLCSFVDQDTMERMRLAGLLTRDYRKPERKKPGQAGKRKKFTWKKR